MRSKLLLTVAIACLLTFISGVVADWRMKLAIETVRAEVGTLDRDIAKLALVKRRIEDQSAAAASEQLKGFLGDMDSSETSRYIQFKKVGPKVTVPPPPTDYDLECREQHCRFTQVGVEFDQPSGTFYTKAPPIVRWDVSHMERPPKDARSVGWPRATVSLRRVIDPAQAVVLGDSRPWAIGVTSYDAGKLSLEQWADRKAALLKRSDLKRLSLPTSVLSAPAILFDADLVLVKDGAVIYEIEFPGLQKFTVAGRYGADDPYETCAHEFLDSLRATRLTQGCQGFHCSFTELGLSLDLPERLTVNQRNRDGMTFINEGYGDAPFVEIGPPTSHWTYNAPVHLASVRMAAFKARGRTIEDWRHAVSKTDRASGRKLMPTDMHIDDEPVWMLPSTGASRSYWVKSNDLIYIVAADAGSIFESDSGVLLYAAQPFGDTGLRRFFDSIHFNGSKRKSKP